MSFSPPPILHATAESVKTEIIPCTIASDLSGDLNLIKQGDAVFLSGMLTISGTLAAKRSVTIGTIPAGYRPAEDVGGLGISAYAAGYVTIKSNGEIVFLPAVNALASLYISAICWKISQ
ncbi:hypothetical protein [Varibaculum cambriense]|uniref:hypothetical protein n=1 Tax=Varibaculum cambriense TaxID=184870 RepID=UPI0029120561|nr:hypothetical protein [Varibaculum cambriense]MDU5542810.1 hypothetical protein [Varibaculum cambriense]